MTLVYTAIICYSLLLLEPGFNYILDYMVDDLVTYLYNKGY